MRRNTGFDNLFTAGWLFLSVRIIVCLVFMCSVLTAGKAQPQLFTHIDAFDGLSANRILHILQLTDGRMVFTTPRTINLFDGARFRYFTIPDGYSCSLPAYEGAYHVYQGRGDLLWIKDYGMAACFDLRRDCFVQHLRQIIQRLNGGKGTVVDVFPDSEGTLWLVRADGSVWNPVRKRLYRFPSGTGRLQDLDVKNEKGYFFFNTGKVVCVSLKTGRTDYERAAYPASDIPKYAWMSLVVKAPDGNFYQLRNGRTPGNGRAAVCLQFNPVTRKWKTLLSTSYILHTLIVPDGNTACVTCGKGLWKLDLKGDKASYLPSLQMVEGNSITTDINTIYEDRDGGWWLGTADRGLLYGHPWRDEYLQEGRVQARSRIFRPVLAGWSVNGKMAGPGKNGLSRVESAPFIRNLELEPEQNSLSFDFSAMNYAFPVKTCYRYRLLSSRDSAWHIVVFDPQQKTVDEKGILHLSFSRLEPGFYRLQVCAATDTAVLIKAPFTELSFLIHTPWWRTFWAYALYALVFAGIVTVGYLFWRNQKNRRKKEQLLLERIRALIERCNRYESEKTEAGREEQEQNIPSPLNSQDNEFLQRAVELVKAHLNSGYTVEDLSRDLCMERTGLYKKLTVLMDQSPSLFIRNIRLQQAASLLMENKLGIGDIALATGFSSSSYFSKCFQEKYGCKPSEYAEKQHKST